MEYNPLTPLLVYKDLYESSYKDLIKYGLTPDQASRKANIYCVKNTWRFFISEDKEATLYRTLLYAKLTVAKESNNLVGLIEMGEYPEEVLVALNKTCTPEDFKDQDKALKAMPIEDRIAIHSRTLEILKSRAKLKPNERLFSVFASNQSLFRWAAQESGRPLTVKEAIVWVNNKLKEADETVS